MRRRTNTSERGAVSLFIVIFSALLITIITVAFVRIMIQNQLQATTDSLSKNALDSAFAGVEDAKRAIIKYQTQCSGANATLPDCTDLVKALTANPQKCSTLQDSHTSGKVGDSEVKVQQKPDDANDPDLKLDQAYTCVKIALNTNDYIGDMTANSSRLIHLKTEDDKLFNTVTVQWYSQKDVQGAGSTGSSGNTVDLYTNPQGLASPPLPKLDDSTSTGWPKNRPPILRVQLVQFGTGGFHLSDFDNNTNNASLFLYPSNYGARILSFASDFRRSQSSTALQNVDCSANTGSDYSCSATISLPDIDASGNTTRDAYLRIGEIYASDTHFSVSMQNTSGATANPVKFGTVQPEVDSTGRANDLFRRVKSRVDLEGSTIPDVQAAIDVTGSLCKDFVVTDETSGYDGGLCQK